MQDLPRDGIVIPRSSRETFVPLQHPNCAILRDAGILLAGISTLTKGYRVYRKAPDFHLVLSTISGEAEVRCGDSSSRLKAGDAFVAPVGNPYGYAPVTYPWVILWFHLSGVSNRRGLDGSPVRILQDAGTLSPVEPFMRGLALETLRQHRGGARICSLYSELILEYLDRLLERTAAGRIAEMRHRFAAVWDRVNADLGREWDAKEVSLLAGFSPTHFTRLCRELYGTTPMRMVARLRMDRAREMVWYTDRPIALIAEQVGYGDPFAFSTAFKKRFGKSPAGYRIGPP